MTGAPVAPRAIDTALARWVLERTGSALLARAALEASAAEGQGHACARLDEPPHGEPFSAADLAALRGQPWVGDGGAEQPTAFVLDATRFYAWRSWRHEAVLAEALRRRIERHRPHPAFDGTGDLAALFAGDDPQATALQREAAAGVVGSRLFVLTGGPGTGKTTTVVRMLLMLLREAAAAGTRPTVALAAPTGKAARRLAQAIAQGKQGLAGSLPHGSGLAALLDAIPHERSQTLHRLLGYRPDANAFVHGPADPLAADIVVVDEASMIDLALMRQLVDALRPGAVLILLGDPGQLASVDAGSVLADIVASAPALAGHVVELTHVWRAGDALRRGIDAVRAGDATWLDASGGTIDGDGLAWRACPDARALGAAVEDWIARHAVAFDVLFAPDVAPGPALAALREAQILCALREGPFGVHGVNGQVARGLARRHGFDPQRPWHRGRPVIVTRNDYASGLFNGDVGVVLDGPDGPRVWFEVGDRDGATALRSFAPHMLPVHESAWAITIHRSQGSEYTDVAVVLPPAADHPVLTRELVYTGVSRARRSAEVWATADSLHAALARPVRRHGGLRERLVAP